MSSIEVMQSLHIQVILILVYTLMRLSETVIGQLYRNDEVAKAQIDVILSDTGSPAIKTGFNLSQREAAVQQFRACLETHG